MGVFRTVLSLAIHNGKAGLKNKSNSSFRPLLTCAPVAMVGFDRSAHTQELTKNIQYISNDKTKLTADPSTMKLDKLPNKPICIMINWLLARQKHVMKYASIYLEQGFDVVSVNCTPWQLMWPTKGSQLVAEDVIKLMAANDNGQPLMLHGFSVAGYIMGEICAHTMKNKDLYQPALDRVVAQIWDSAADISELSIGVPAAVFPKNKIMQKTLRAYMEYHMKTFHEAATIHYIRSSQLFHSNLCRAPALFLLSRSDPVGAERSNRDVHDCWVELGIKCTWKCWERSPHVQHFNLHKKEYLEALSEHLDAAHLLLQPEKLRQRLDNEVKKPLCIFMNWMLARPNHIMKYAVIYLEQGMDVVSVSCTPWQLMWPKKGAQIVGKDLMDFLAVNNITPLALHGFSVGAYLWGEGLIYAMRNKEKFQPILDKMKTQVWDSAADITEIPVGFPSAVFPKNLFLQNALRAYTKFHLKLFHSAATQHYLASSHMFHHPASRAPALFLLSKTDPVGAEGSNRDVHDCWVKDGIQCTWKCWDRSPHVLHYFHHSKEYLELVYEHLDKHGLITNRDKMLARLEKS